MGGCTLKTISKLVLSLVFISQLGGCVAPNTYIGARTNSYIKDDDKVNESIAFKHAFAYAMPASEKGMFDKMLLNADYSDDSWDRMMRQDGFNTLLIGGAGIAPTSSLGMGLGLGLGLVDSYLARQSLKDNFSYAYFTTKTSGDISKDKENVFNNAVKQTRESVYLMAEEFDYNVECKNNCNSHSATYLLTKKSLNNNPEVFEPEKVVVNLMMTDLGELDEKSPAKKVLERTPGDVSFHAPLWSVTICSKPKSGFAFSEFKHKLFEHHGVESVMNLMCYDLDRTVLGRNMLRSISKKLPFWITYSDDGFKNYGIYKSQMYWLDDITKAESLKGYPITN